MSRYPEVWMVGFNFCAIEANLPIDIMITHYFYISSRLFHSRPDDSILQDLQIILGALIVGYVTFEVQLI